MKCPICDGMGTSNTCVNGTFKPCSFCDGTGEVMTTWEEIRDEIAGMLADGQPLEDVISKLDEMKKPKQITNEERLRQANTEQLARVIHLMTTCCYVCGKDGVDYKRCYFHKKCAGPKEIEEWLKEIHHAE